MKLIIILSILISTQAFANSQNGNCFSKDWNKLSYFSKKLTSDIDSDGDKNDHKNSFEVICYKSWPSSEAQVEYLLGALLGLKSNYAQKTPKDVSTLKMLKSFSILNMLTKQNSFKGFERALNRLIPKLSPGYWFIDLDSGESIMIYNKVTKENYIIIGYEK